MMDNKTKVKSILPKPSPQLSSQVSSPTLAGSKRKSLPGNSPDFNVAKKQRSKSSATIPTTKKAPPISKKIESPDIMNSPIDPPSHEKSKQTGHRPVTSCTFCRQHKIKCNASDNYPNPCQRCDRMGLKCEIDPQFRPKKGSQIQSLKSDVDELKAKIEMLTKNESLLTQALNQHNLNFLQQQQHNQHPGHQSLQLSSPSHFGHHNQQQQQLYNTTPVQRPTLGTMSNYSTTSNNTPTNFQLDRSPHSFQPLANVSPSTTNMSHNILNDSIPNQTNPNLTHVLQHESTDNSPATISNDNDKLNDLKKPDPASNPNSNSNNEVDYGNISEFILGNVSLPLEKANELHDRFMIKFLPFLPIITSRSATELYHRSQLLFWSVILTAALSEPEPTLYMSLASLIKQLAIETCWIRTPRSTHVIQALIILSIWPLPNEKVLDDCSYRFIGLAKNLSLQLGLHRGGEFIQEFSRTQVSLGPDAELWRTRSWLAIFFCEQFWSSVLGLPPSINTTDYLLENARVDLSLPKNYRCLISLSIFQCKLVNVMGISVTRSDGLLEPSNRAGSLNILDRELERLKFKLPIEDGSVIEVYYLYIKLMICCFAFLPGTPIEDQVKYVSSAYLSATRIVTITSKMISSNTIMLIELPIYVRQAITYSVLLLFKLHLSRYLIDEYVDSARQSIVTVHRLLRNTLSSWKDLQNDILRTAKVLENLNIVLYTYPEIFDDSINNDVNDNSSDSGNKDNKIDYVGGGSIITRMRSHLTASLFYDLVWCVHEARRRTLIDKNNGVMRKDQKNDSVNTTNGGNDSKRKPAPLPFYNQITKDDFKTITTTTPNGTTITTLVPTDQAMTQARTNANANGLNKPLEINGIPLAMLEATGSMKDIDTINTKKINEVAAGPMNTLNGSGPVSKLNSINATNISTPQVKEEYMENISNPAAFPQFNQSPTLPSSAINPERFDQLSSNPSNPATQLYIQNNDKGVDSTATPVNFQYGMSGANLPSNSTNLANMNEQGLTDVNGVANQMDNFFQQQSNGWLNNDNYQDDDFLGWFDVNMIPEK